MRTAMIAETMIMPFDSEEIKRITGMAEAAIMDPRDTKSDV